MIDSREIRTREILIRPLEASDYSHFSELNADQGFSDFMGSIREDRLACGFQKQIDSVLKSGTGSRAICRLQGGDFLGIIGIFVKGNAPEIYGSILKRFRKKGYASKAIQAISQSIFSRTDHRKVKAVVDKDNSPGKITVEHAGFKESHPVYDELRKKETLVFYKQRQSLPSRAD